MNIETRLLLDEFNNSRERLLTRQIVLIDRFVRNYVEDVWLAKGYVDVRYGHLSCLLNVQPDGSSVNYLAGKAQITKQAMSQLVKELEALGYVKTIVDEQDRRARVITVTEKALGLIRLLKGAGQEMDERFLDIIGHEKLEQLLSLQTELAQGLYSA